MCNALDVDNSEDEWEVLRAAAASVVELLTASVELFEVEEAAAAAALLFFNGDEDVFDGDIFPPLKALLIIRFYHLSCS